MAEVEVCRCTYCTHLPHVLAWGALSSAEASSALAPALPNAKAGVLAAPFNNKQPAAVLLTRKDEGVVVASASDAKVVGTSSSSVLTRFKNWFVGTPKTRRKKNFYLKRWILIGWIVLIAILIYEKFLGVPTSKRLEYIMDVYDTDAIPGIPENVDHTTDHLAKVAGWKEDLSFTTWYDSHVSSAWQSHKSFYEAHNMPRPEELR